MDITTNDFLRSIMEQIDELFTDEVGPVAAILCDEEREQWEQDLIRRGQRPGLRNMPLYVRKLAQHIEDEENCQHFLDSVFQIEALGLFNKS